MPRRHFIPLMLRGTPRQNHLHAAITAWFDTGATVSHDSNHKPYTISPPTVIDGLPGVIVTTFSDDADAVLEQVAARRPALFLGKQGKVLVGAPRVLLERSWRQITVTVPPAARAWRVDFLSPTQFRSGERINLLPNSQHVLNAALMACGRSVPDALPDKADRPLHRLLVTDIDLTTDSYAFGDITYVGFVGDVIYRAPTRQVAEAVAPLPFVGVGSYRVRGLGCVDVSPIQQSSRQSNTHGRRSA